VSLAALIGREQELADLDAALLSPGPLCLTGEPGVGKTALATAWAEGRGAAWCSLADTASRDEAVAALLHALGQQPGDDPPDALHDRLTRALTQPTLLVIDQAEHLIADLWVSLANARATLLITTRVTPPAVRVLCLAPLSLEAAGHLWASRCARPLESSLAEALGGNPLALELAASLARHLPSHRLLDALRADASLLSSIQRSWELLDADARAALSRLAALPHSVDFELAEHVVGSLALIARLGDASLLRVLDQQVHVLPSVHAFVRARDLGELDAGLAALAGWLLDRAQGWPEHIDDDPDRLDWIARMMPALTLLMERYVAHPQGAACALLLAARLLTERGPSHLLDGWLRVIAPGAPRDGWGIEVALLRARRQQRAGQREAAAASLTLAEQAAHDPALRTRVLYTRGVVAHEANDVVGARAAWQAALEGGDERATPHTIAHTMLRLATIDDALLPTLAPRALALFQAHHNLYGECLARGHLAEQERRAGRAEPARLELERVLGLNQRLGSHTLTAHTLLQLARALRTSAPAQAAQRTGQAADLYAQIGHAWGECVARIDEANLLREAGRLDAAWEALALAERASVHLARPHLDRAISASRGCWELAYAASRPAEAAAYIEGARARVAALEAACPREVESAYTQRWRAALIAALERAVGGARVRVSRDGTWIEAPDQARAALAHRPALRHIVAALAALPRGEWLELEALWSAGWPGERVSAESQRNRVHVALNTLRKLGLQEALLCEAGRWALDPARVLVVTSPA
jgi:hypothetical protein